MVLKTYILQGEIPAGASWTRLDELTTPSGVTRKIVEIRPYATATSGVRLRLNLRTEVIYELSAEVINSIKYPYPSDLVVPAGMNVVLEAMNPTASAATVIVELVVEETAK